MNAKLNTPAMTLMSIAVLLTVSACSMPERSRDLNDASISVSTTALQVCANCHGAKGVSTSPNFPNLAAQTQPYLVKQLTDFRSHGRADPEGYEYMWGLSEHLTDAQISGLATYFSQLPPSPGNQDKTGTPVMLQEGQTIFDQGIADKSVPACASCHGAHGEGNDSFPRLAGQHSDYLIKQLTIFQRTDQRPDGVAMKAVTHNLSPENMRSVAAYLESMAPATVAQH